LTRQFPSWALHLALHYAPIIELDDGKIETGNPYDLDGKKHGFWLRFSQQSQSIEPNVPFTGSTSLDQAAWSTGGARRLQNLRG